MIYGKFKFSQRSQFNGNKNLQKIPDTPFRSDLEMDSGWKKHAPQLWRE